MQYINKDNIIGADIVEPYNMKINDWSDEINCGWAVFIRFCGGYNHRYEFENENECQECIDKLGLTKL